jgi:hypothetical protein
MPVKNGPSFACPARYALNTSAWTATNPTQSTCCVFAPSCAAPTEGSSSAFACPTGYAPKSDAANATNPNRTTCCQFVPTCGFFNESDASFPCPTGYVLDSSKAAATSPNATRCCKEPALGECEVPQLLPVIYSPRGNNQDLLTRAMPMLVVFPSADSREAYCPAGTCTVRMLSLPMLSTAAGDGAGGTDSFEMLTTPMQCFSWNALACEVGVPLGSQGRWMVSLLPAVNSTDMYCDRTTLLQPAITEVCAHASVCASAI